MIKNYMERAFVPYNSPSGTIRAKDRYFLFAPIAGANKAGMASYSTDDFTIIDGKVYLKNKFVFDEDDFTIDAGKVSLKMSTAVDEKYFSIMGEKITVANKYRGILEVPLRTDYYVNGEGKDVGRGSIAAYDPKDVGESDADKSMSKASGRCAIAFGRYNTAAGDYSFVNGYQSFTHKSYSFVHGRDINKDTEGGQYITAFGYRHKITGDYAAIFGKENEANGRCSFASGEYSDANGEQSTARGNACIANGQGSIAEGWTCTADGKYSRAMNAHTYAKGAGSNAAGYKCNAIGHYSFAGGTETTAGIDTIRPATGDAPYWNEFAYGRGLIARGNSQACFGLYNYLAPTTDDETKSRLFYIGNGSSDTDRRNAFSVTRAGDIISAGKLTQNGADYAEYFEWEDGNTENEDRVGYLVSLTSTGKIKKADVGDEIFGIVSATPSVIGNAYEDEWQGKYLTDEWGRKQYELVTYIAEYDEAGNLISPEYSAEIPLLNPEYDETIEYIPRSERKEWAPIGLLGQLLVRDSGDSKVGDYLTARAGMGVKSDTRTNIRVIAKVSDDIVKVLIK